MYSRISKLLAIGLMMTIGLSLLSIVLPGPIEDAEGARFMAGSRMVFVEDITATWCGYCPAASEGLKDLSNQRDDFRFITLVDDRVEDAAARNQEYNPSGFPTVMFDGGYDEQVGAVSSGDEYSDNIDNCLERETPDISIEVTVYDMGGSELSIEVTANNYETEAYNGILKVMIVEKVSRYLDADGNNYPNSMLAYAIDNTVSVGAGEETTVTESWIGSDVEDMLGDDFGDIDPNNIVVYAAMFNENENYKTRMGVPPSYYVANYCDYVAEGFPMEMGDAPTVEITSPGDGSTVSDTITITAEVTAESGIETVEVKMGQGSWMEMYLDGDEYLYEWDTTEERNGDTGISVKATDDQGLSGIDNIDVTVENEGAPTPPEISSLTHTPLFPKEGDTITINLEIDVYDTSITSAEAVICLDGTCLPPKDMFEQSMDRYSLEIGPYEGGQIVTYHVVIEDSEGNILESSEKEFSIQESIVQPDDDDDIAPDDDAVVDDDDATGDVQGSADQTPLLIIGGIIGLIIFIVVIIVIVLSIIRRGEKEQETQQSYNTPSPPVYAGEIVDEELELESGIQVK
jgi:hypothetical protein